MLVHLLFEFRPTCIVLKHFFVTIPAVVCFYREAIKLPMPGQTLLTPFQKFIRAERVAGLLLFGATLVALLWANSPYRHSYDALWQMPLQIGLNGTGLSKPLILWINDGLMAVFFFLIGMELKRELITGEINTLKKAAFPVVAATGGVVFPIVLYLLLNQNEATRPGWGIPMATDIAFALAILTSLGKRIPLSLKVFLTAFAIIDDLAAVLVIAIFYSGSIAWHLLAAGLLLTGLMGFYFARWRFAPVMGMTGALIVWLLFLKSGVHPTIAGVLLAFTIPIRRQIAMGQFINSLTEVSNQLKASSSGKQRHLLTTDEVRCVNKLDSLIAEARSPLQNLEHKLHGPVAYFILPLFALANAGVDLQFSGPVDSGFVMQVAVSLVVGKFVGIVLFSYAGLKSGWVQLPGDLTFRHITGVSALAGVGFTMSIFIANLAFGEDPANLMAAKAGILFGSFLAGLAGLLLLRFYAPERKR